MKETLESRGVVQNQKRYIRIKAVERTRKTRVNGIKSSYSEIKFVMHTKLVAVDLPAIKPCRQRQSEICYRT